VSVFPLNAPTRVCLAACRHEIAKEWIEELQAVAEENSALMQETLLASLSATPDGPPRRRVDIEELDDSAGGSDD
jgi:hypothetical protein